MVTNTLSHNQQMKTPRFLKCSKDVVILKIRAPSISAKKRAFLCRGIKRTILDVGPETRIFALVFNDEANVTIKIHFEPTEKNLIDAFSYLLSISIRIKKFAQSQK